MNDRAAIRAGMAGALLAALCCAAPLLAIVCRWQVLARGWRRRALWCFPLWSPASVLWRGASIIAVSKPPAPRRIDKEGVRP